MNGFAGLARLMAPGVPDPGTGTQPPGGEKIVLVLSYAAWVVMAAAVLGVLIVAGRMVLQHRRGGGEEHGGALGWVLAGCIIAGSAAGIVQVFV